MNIEILREYCLSLPHVTEDMAFGEEHLLFRVCDKIFACMGLGQQDYFVVKCNPIKAIELRERYAGVEPAWHWNKKYWNQLALDGRLPDDMIRNLVRHSYSEVVAKLPKRTKEAFPDMLQIN